MGLQTELYSFRHDLYRELLYERPSGDTPGRSAIPASAVLARKPPGPVNWTQIAAELAEHFRARQRICARDPTPPTCRCQRPCAGSGQRGGNQSPAARARSPSGTLQNEVDRTQVEVELRSGLGAAHMAIRGFGAPEVLENYARAEALSDQLGERVDLFPAIWGQWMFRTGRGETNASAARWAQRLFILAEKFDDPGLKIQAHHAMWSTSFVCGELGMARAHAQSGLALFDAKLHQSMASRATAITTPRVARVISAPCRWLPLPATLTRRAR